MEFTLKVTPNARNIPAVRDVPFNRLRASVNIYSLGQRGRLEAEVFRRPGTLVASFGFPISELYAPLLIRVTKLDPSTLHKIVTSLDCNNQSLSSQVFFISTQEAEPSSEEEAKDEATIGLSKSETDVLTATENYKIEILEGRKSKNWQDYIKCGYKHPEAFTATIRDTRIKRSLILGEALEVFDALEETEKSEIINGGWFMGPLYSHDPSYKKMISKI